MRTNNFKIACGSDDGKNFTLNHFGDSRMFLIYEFQEDKGFVFLEKRENNSPEEEKHGDPKKAKGISAIVGDVSLLFAYAMGPNINRMKMNFVVAISRHKNINEALEKLKIYIPQIFSELQKEKEQEKKIFIVN